MAFDLRDELCRGALTDEVDLFLLCILVPLRDQYIWEVGLLNHTDPKHVCELYAVGLAVPGMD